MLNWIEVKKYINTPGSSYTMYFKYFFIIKFAQVFSLIPLSFKVLNLFLNQTFWPNMSVYYKTVAMKVWYL